MKSSGSKKGISPLIASVLLIAFTISISAIVVNWVFGFTKTESKGATEKGSEQIRCSFADINLRGVSFNCTQTDRLNFIIENTGSVKIKEMAFRSFYENKSVEESGLQPEEVNMSKGDVEYFYEDGFDVANVTKLEVFARGCPVRGVDMVSISDVEIC